LTTAIAGADDIGINVLTPEHTGLALTFAGKGDDKFAGPDWSLGSGAPRLPGASWPDHIVVDLVRGGDHVVVPSQVMSAVPRLDEPPIDHNRASGTHLPQQAVREAKA
jgi:flavin reductase (DIM6/NTAB) family NADH-FMN oxidoreductase RutF